MRISTGTVVLIASVACIYSAAVTFRPAFERLVNTPSFIGKPGSGPVDYTSLLPNPVYDEMDEIARSLELDVKFAERTRRGGRPDVRENKIFDDAPAKGWDVIVLGDSALGWSFSAKLVEQASGLKVAFLAASNVPATKPVFDLSQKLADRYLKPDGTLVYLFSAGDWWHVSPKLPATPDMRSLVVDGIPLGNSTRTGLALVGLNIAGQLEDLTFRINRKLQLPDVAFYTQLIEPQVAPTVAKEKAAAKFGQSCEEFEWEPRGGSLFFVCNFNNAFFKT